MSKRLFVITLALLVSLTGSVIAQDATKAPRLTVVDPIKDFGTVAKGDKLDWSFTIKNTGNADLEVINAKPSCGCTVADFDKVIKPGQTGKVTAHVDTTNFAGPIAKAVTIETNDPSTPSAQVTIHAVVKPYVEAHPAGFVRYNLIQGDAETQYVTLYSEESEPFQVVKIESPAEWIKAEYAQVPEAELVQGVGRPGQAQYKLAITVGGPDAKIGPVAEKIKVVTNSPHQPEYLIAVSGVVRPSYRVEPSGVNFGEVAPTDSAATRTVTLKSNNIKAPESFVVTRVESSLKNVKADVKPTANKGEYEVTLQVDKKAKAGELDGNVMIYTSDSAKPVVTVPVKGTIKATTSASK